MAKTDFKSVHEYIASQPEAVPGADEVISYKIPTYKLHGAPVLYFTGWKQHYSLYPATDRTVAPFKDDLARTRSTRAPSASRSPSPSP